MWTLQVRPDWRVLFIWGLTGTGKTQFACHLLDSPLLVRSMDQLREFDAALHDGIVFDDMSFAHLPRESCIHLLDWDLPSSMDWGKTSPKDLLAVKIFRVCAGMTALAYTWPGT